MSKHIDYDEEAKFRVWHLNKTGGAASTCLTVRDYFAAKALQGILANPETEPNMEPVIKAAYQLADAMMKEREK